MILFNPVKGAGNLLPVGYTRLQSSRVWVYCFTTKAAVRKAFVHTGGTRHSSDTACRRSDQYFEKHVWFGIARRPRQTTTRQDRLWEINSSSWSTGCLRAACTCLETPAGRDRRDSTDVGTPVFRIGRAGDTVRSVSSTHQQLGDDVCTTRGGATRPCTNSTIIIIIVTLANRRRPQGSGGTTRRRRTDASVRRDYYNNITGHGTRPAATLPRPIAPPTHDPRDKLRYSLALSRSRDIVRRTKHARTVRDLRRPVPARAFYPLSGRAARVVFPFDISRSPSILRPIVRVCTRLSLLRSRRRRHRVRE